MESQEAVDTNFFGVVERSDPKETPPSNDSKEDTSRDQQEMAYYGKEQQLKACFLDYYSLTWSSHDSPSPQRLSKINLF